jgi:hypothetical protein
MSSSVLPTEYVSFVQSPVYRREMFADHDLWIQSLTIVRLPSSHLCRRSPYADYHFIELFFPMWKLLQKAKERHPFVTIPTNVENMAFFNADSHRTDPPGTPGTHRWQDRAGVNKILIKNALCVAPALHESSNNH